MKDSAQHFLHHVLYLTDSLLKVSSLHHRVSDKVTHFSLTFIQMIHLEKARSLIQNMHCQFGEVQQQANSALVRIQRRSFRMNGSSLVTNHEISLFSTQLTR